MAHRVAPRAEADLDDIWIYAARESGSMEVADRLIDSITARFFLLAQFPHLGLAAARTSALVREALPSVSTSFFIA
jgi:plasmid stabilization system protein ParE